MGRSKRGRRAPVLSTAGSPRSRSAIGIAALIGREGVEDLAAGPSGWLHAMLALGRFDGPPGNLADLTVGLADIVSGREKAAL